MRCRRQIRYGGRHMSRAGQIPGIEDATTEIIKPQQALSIHCTHSPTHSLGIPVGLLDNSLALAGTSTCIYRTSQRASSISLLSFVSSV